MPFGLVFRKAVLWHEGQQFAFTNLRETSSPREAMQWKFQCDCRGEPRIEVTIDGSGPGIHRLPYLKTDCSGSFAVANNSLASASIVIEKAKGQSERLETATGAVLEQVG